MSYHFKDFLLTEVGCLPRQFHLQHISEEAYFDFIQNVDNPFFTLFFDSVLGGVCYCIRILVHSRYSDVFISELHNLYLDEYGEK